MGEYERAHAYFFGYRGNWGSFHEVEDGYIYRKLNRQRSVFPSDTALLKALYLATFEATKKWTSTIRNWAQVYGELSIMYEGRLPE